MSSENDDTEIRKKKPNKYIKCFVMMIGAFFGALIGVIVVSLLIVAWFLVSTIDSPISNTIPTSYLVAIVGGTISGGLISWLALGLAWEYFQDGKE